MKSRTLAKDGSPRREEHRAGGAASDPRTATARPASELHEPGRKGLPVPAGEGGSLPSKAPASGLAALKAAQALSDAPKGTGRVDVTETLKELLALAREQGYLTYDDINDILPDGLTPDDLDELYVKLRNLDIEIVDRSEVARLKQQPE